MFSVVYWRTHCRFYILMFAVLLLWTHSNKVNVVSNNRTVDTNSKDGTYNGSKTSVCHWKHGCIQEHRYQANSFSTKIINNQLTLQKLKKYKGKISASSILHFITRISLTKSFFKLKQKQIFKKEFKKSWHKMYKTKSIKHDVMKNGLST